MTRSLVLHPDLGRTSHPDPQARLAEAESLTAAIDLTVADAMVVPVPRPHPATLFGPGKVEELRALVAQNEAGLVIVDSTLSPVQQRNLERQLKAKVLDRTGLILEIFGARAQTREGVLQVELAHLTYQKSRLVRSWTHLERQRGGTGFLGGPGETQIEADRRVLDDKITRLKRQLEKVVKTRSLHRAKRQKVPYPVVALVGYTNAGKSTLFNRLTQADVMAEDMLFATLDPTMRRLQLPSGRTAILSDTVGFISDLPTQLIAAFRATLEEVLEADLLIHVRDISHADSAEQASDVEAVLGDLGITDTSRMVEAQNKIDLLDPETRSIVQQRRGAVAVSAVTGDGLDALMREIEARLYPRRLVFRMHLGHRDGAAMGWLYDHGEVLTRSDDETGVALSVALTEIEFFRFRKQHGNHVTSVRPANLAAQ